MKVLVVFETMFGNTKQIADAIADGLATDTEVVTTDVTDAPTALPPDIAALVVGGPTHVFSMSTRSTRQSAVHRGGVLREAPIGIREWLHMLPDPPRDLRFAAFDTRVDMPLMPGAASRSASRYARKRGFHVLPPEGFLVDGYEGPLLDGELDRARSWGEGICRVITGD